MSEPRELYLTRSGEANGAKELKLILDDGGLSMYSLNGDGNYKPVNPFCFGAAFNFRGMNEVELTELESFLASTGYTRDPHGISFPHDEQTAIMEHYLLDELNATLSVEKRLILCELIEQLYPAFWPQLVEPNHCILYDGFYGQSLSQQYLPFHSARSYEGLVSEVFGVARKDTLRESRKIDAFGFTVAYVFKDLLPVEVILQRVTGSISSFDFPVTPETYKPLLKLSQPQRVHLLEDLVNNSKLEPWVFEDALELLNDFPNEILKRLKGANTWEELHERLMRYCDVIEGSGEIRIPDSLEPLESPVENLHFIPLKRAKEFAMIGEFLEICLGKAGYYKKAVNGETFCFSGFSGGVPKAALEVILRENSWKVLQLRGHNNAALENSKTLISLIEQRLNGDGNG